jgi:tetratricopeptide (TPR) repeat protein
MTETAILSNQREAMRLFQRGVAAARAGQKRVAVGLLQRAVQLDPRHELAWLWLSGVLDEPQEVAFCLRSVLAINPANERAKAGLAYLERQKALGAAKGQGGQNGHVQLAGAVDGQSQAAERPTSGGALATSNGSTTTLRLPTIGGEESAAARDARAQGESWWVNWRRSRRDMSRARMIGWLVPILLLTLTLAWRASVEVTVAQVQANLRPTVAPPTVAPTAAPDPFATPVPLPPGRPRASDDAAVLAYLSQIEPLRAQLRQAVEDYRQAIRRPGGSSIQHSAAARQLRAKVQNAHATLTSMSTPESIAHLHAEYLAGLEIELQGLDDLLAFYGEYNVALANRAALRFQESNARFTRAQAGFDQHLGQIDRQASGMPPQSPR